MDHMKHILSYTRRAVDDYSMIRAGDKIAVGVSAGKDSLTLLCAMAGLRRFYPQPFELIAITVDMGFGGIEANQGKEMPAEDFDAVASFSKSQKRSGMILWEEESVSAMHPDYLPVTVLDSGKLHYKSQDRVYTRESFGELMETVDNSIRQIARDMRRGVITANPLKGKKADTCERCPYRPVCRKTK